MSIIKQYHKDTDTTYVYESESYWDPERKQARSRRKCIGKIDPKTGEVIPTGKRGRKKDQSEPATADSKELTKLYEEYEKVQKENLSLSKKIVSLETELSYTLKQLKKYQTTVNKIEELTAKL